MALSCREALERALASIDALISEAARVRSELYEIQTELTPVMKPGESQQLRAAAAQCASHDNGLRCTMRTGHVLAHGALLNGSPRRWG